MPTLMPVYELSDPLWIPHLQAVRRAFGPGDGVVGEERRREAKRRGSQKSTGKSFIFGSNLITSRCWSVITKRVPRLSSHHFRHRAAMATLSPPLFEFVHEQRLVSM